jgi:hypothetical protein
MMHGHLGPTEIACAASVGSLIRTAKTPLCSILHRLAPPRFAINAPSRSVSGSSRAR